MLFVALVALFPPGPPLVRAWTAFVGHEIVDSAAVGSTGFYSCWREVGAVDLKTGKFKWRFAYPKGQSGHLLTIGPGRVLTDVWDEKADRQRWWVLDAAKGKLLDRIDAGKRTPKGTLVGNTLFTSTDSGLAAMSLPSKKVLWTYKLGGQSREHLADPPFVADGTVLIQDPQGQTYALDAKTGRKLWTAKTQYFDRLPIATNGVAIVRKDRLEGRDLRTGKLLWSRKSEGYGNDAWTEPGLVMLAVSGALEAYDAKTGRPLWSTRVQSPNVFGGSRDVVRGDGFYLARGDATYAIGRDGKVRWKWRAPNGNPLWGDKQGVVVVDEKRIIGYRPGTLRPLPTDVVARKRTTQTILSQWDKLDDSERARLVSLRDVAYEPLLRFYIHERLKPAYDEESYSQTLEGDRSEAALKLLDAATQIENTSLLVAILEKGGLPPEARAGLTQILSRKGETSATGARYLKALRDTPASVWQKNAEAVQAYRFFLKNPHPEATPILIAAMKDKSVPPELRKELYTNLADRNGPEAVAAVLTLREQVKPLPSLRQRFLASQPKQVAIKSDWILATSSILGSHSDLWLVRGPLAAPEELIFTGVASAPASGFVDRNRTPSKYKGRLVADLVKDGWFEVFVEEPALRIDSDQDGLSDVAEARFGTDRLAKDTDGDGKDDPHDPWPTAKPGVDLTDAEKVVAAAFEARYSFDEADGIALFKAPVGFTPFEMAGRSDPTLWSIGHTWDHPLAKLYEQGIALIGIDGASEVSKTETWDKQAIKWNANRTEASLTISTYWGGLAGDGHFVRLRKFGDEWVVVEMAMSYIS